MKTLSTKRALFASVLSLLLCVTMLVGSTFAWFTDTATASVNTITAGTLDVSLEMLDNDGKWVSAEGKTLQFLVDGKIPAEGTEILWEPGCTYSLPALRVKNGGNLALKYKVVLTGIKGDAELNDVIDWTIDGADLGVTKSLAPQASTQFTITGHMQATAGNAYMGKTISGITISVIATQDSAEYDSNGNTYDEGAEYPVFAAASVTADENGLAANETTLVSGTKHESGNALASAVVPVGSKLKENATQLALSIVEAAIPSNFTVAITQNAPKTLEISMEGLAADNDKPIKVEFYIEKGLSLVEIDHNGRKMSRCGALKWVDEDQEFYYDATTGLVTMLTKDFSPFTYTSDKFQWDDRKAAAYATPVDTENKVITVSNAAELALFKYEVTDKKVNYSGYTLNITADIDLGDGFWRPINKLDDFTINGNGHTIRNLLVRSCINSANGGYGFAFIGNSTGNLAIKELTFDNASVARAKGYENYFAGNIGGVVVAYTYGTTLFENVKVINSSVYGYGKIGMLLGMGASPGIKVTFKNCVSKNNAVYGAYDLGGLAGNIQRGNGVDNGSVENCIVENIHVVYDPSKSYIALDGVSATFKSNDKPNGEDIAKTITAKCLIEAGYYWCCYGDYYVSYGDSSYDATVEGYDLCLANSEYPVNAE